MTPPCPKCRDAVLSRSKQLSPPVFQCGNCHGLWLLPGEAELLAAQKAPAASMEGRAAHDKKGGFCPFGHGLLERARVEPNDTDAFYLERCRVCSGVFFDDGEWGRLAESRLFAHLHELWDPTFQERVYEEKSRRRWRQQLASQLGDDTMLALEKLADTLATSGHVSEAMAYLTDRVREALHQQPEPVLPRRMRKVDALLLHVLPATTRLENYGPDSLATEGFVHLCHRDQLIEVLTRHFGFHRDLEQRASVVSDVNVLVLDATRLLSPVKEEETGHGVFPHLYGPLRQDAILRVVPVARDLGYSDILRIVDEAIDNP